MVSNAASDFEQTFQKTCRLHLASCQELRPAKLFVDLTFYRLSAAVLISKVVHFDSS